METKMEQASGYLIALGCGKSKRSQEEANRSAFKAAGIAHLNIKAAGIAHLNIKEISIPGVLPKDTKKIAAKTIPPGTVLPCIYARIEENEELKFVGVATAKAANSNEEFIIISQARGKNKNDVERQLKEKLQAKASARGLKSNNEVYYTKCLNKSSKPYQSVIATIGIIN